LTRLVSEQRRPGRSQGTKRVERLWCTAITLDVRDPISVRLGDDVFAWFAQVDRLFSTWRPDSEISRLGAGDLTLDQVNPDVREVLGLCAWVQELSFGAFDIRVGADPRVAPREGLGPIDPSGLVKGWALGRAGRLLRAEGVANFAINAGGDVVTAGHARPGQRWRVGIQHPWERDKVAAVIGVSDLGVATSGRYERGDHIIDPRTGSPATGLMSVTVISGDSALADAYATAALVLGEDGPAWLSERQGVAGMVISDDGSVTLINDFDGHRVN
jgi:FAD:protein FMN transferase